MNKNLNKNIEAVIREFNAGMMRSGALDFNRRPLWITHVFHPHARRGFSVSAVITGGGLIFLLHPGVYCAFSNINVFFFIF